MYVEGGEGGGGDGGFLIGELNEQAGGGEQSTFRLEHCRVEGGEIRR